MPSPLVHALILNWNGLDHVETCFSSLLEGTYENVQYILVDNASDDGSVEFVRDRFGNDPRVRILECTENLGWSGGNNAAMERSLAEGAEFIFLLNNDTATAKDAIEQMVEAMCSNPSIGALAPKMLLFDQPFLLNSIGLECSVIGASWDRGIGRVDGDAWNQPQRVIGVCGGAMFLRSEVLRQTGLLPEGFEIYLDDLDLCLRIWDAGSEIWTCPQATVRHKFSATYGQGRRARKKYYLNTRNRFRVLLRNFPLAQLPLVLPRVIQGEIKALGRAVLDRAWWRLGAHLRAWGSAVAYLPTALHVRSHNRAAGRQTGQFWPLLNRDILFCPELVLPDSGWFPEREVGGRWLRAMSARAWLDLPGGALRVLHANCYPAIGAVDVRILYDGNVVAEVGGSSGELHLELPPGRLDFEARSIFRAEDTGEAVDIGGWFAVLPASS